MEGFSSPCSSVWLLFISTQLLHEATGVDMLADLACGRCFWHKWTFPMRREVHQQETAQLPSLPAFLQWRRSLLPLQPLRQRLSRLQPLP